MRNGEDDKAGFFGVDVRRESAACAFKAIACVLLQAADALLPGWNAVHVQQIHAVPEALKVCVVHRGGGKQHRSDGFAVHALMMRAGDRRLQKAHRDGVGIDVNLEAVLLAVIDEALGDRFAFVKLVILRD